MHTILIFLAFLVPATSADDKCYQKFPLHETSKIMKTLVKSFAETKNETDEDGTLWMNRIFLTSKGGYEVDGITYYLNSNEFPPENTFYFDAQRFLSVPVFVIPSTLETTWRPAYPDRTYELSKISLACPPKSRACGLKCCSMENKEVVERLNEYLLSTSEKSHFEYKSRRYSFSDSSLNCSYHLSFYDNVHRTGDDVKNSVYFECPAGYDCCGLTCTESPYTEKQRTARSLSFETVSGAVRENIVYCALIVTVAIMLIGRIIYALCKQNKTRNQKCPKRTVLQREESICTKCRLTEDTRLSIEEEV